MSSQAGTGHRQKVGSNHVTITTTAQDILGRQKAPRDILIQNNDASGIVYLYLRPANQTTGKAHLSLRFTSGGTYEISVGDTITGATGGATAKVTGVNLESGTWAGGDAAGTLEIDTISGTFQAENLNVGANLNVATIAADAYIKGMFRVLPGGGTFQMNGIVNAVSAIGSASNENVAISEGR